MNAHVAKVDLCLDVVQRPARLHSGRPLMARVGSDRRVSLVDRMSSKVRYSGHKAATTAHDESPVPLVREQQFESNRTADEAFNINMCYANGSQTTSKVVDVRRTVGVMVRGRDNANVGQTQLF